MADYTYRFRFLTDDLPASKKVRFSYWRSLPHKEIFNVYNILDEAKLPVKAGGLWDQGKRFKVQV